MASIDILSFLAKPSNNNFSFSDVLTLRLLIRLVLYGNPLKMQK